jgi:alpha-ketoglutarate-dependent taurine dioxygenase
METALKGLDSGIVMQSDITLPSISDPAAATPGTRLVAQARRRPVALSQARELVTGGACPDTGGAPFVISSAIHGLSLRDWVAQERDRVMRLLTEHGAVLFRGFDDATPPNLAQIAHGFSGGLYEYTFRASPRTEVAPNIYTSTDYPANLSIFPHNEHAFSPVFPHILYFLCQRPAIGGATPVGDCRRLLRIIAPRIVERFRQRQILYVRRYSEHVGLPWQIVFQTDDPSQVARYCTQMGIAWNWSAAGVLETRYRADPIVRHPVTGEDVWFNHATFHNALSLDAEVKDCLTAGLGEDLLPNNTYYGDGSAIEPDVIAELREAYLSIMMRFEWQAGDLLVLDNILFCHGRDPFSGPRRVVVGMSRPTRLRDLA